MKAVILAGGYGTRISEETAQLPKPMIEIGGQPLLWHIMKIYSHWGIDDFVVCLGYKGYVIKEYFANYALHMSDVTLDIQSNHVEVHQNTAEPWRVTLVDTGLDTMTGGRLKRVKQYLGNETFCMTYGDGLSDVNIRALVDFHRGHGKLASVTAISLPSRFGVLATDGDVVIEVREKPEKTESLINGGFFVLDSAALDTIHGDETIWEREPLERLAGAGQLMCFRHSGFWQPVDTLREKRLVEDLWNSRRAPWRVW